MSIKTLKSIARRGSYLAGAFAVFAAVLIPSSAAFADSLNPLTKRSLLLSSSAPGYTDTDGSGNSTDSQNSINENYAPAGTGPNGKKSGETFTFNVSTNSSAGEKELKGFTLQYCTTAAGNCQAPGDNEKITASNLGDARNGLWNGGVNATGRPTNAEANPLGRSDFDIVSDGTTPWAQGSGAGQFQVLVAGVPSTGWTMVTDNVEDDAHSGKLTGKENFITLLNTGDSAKPNSGDKIELVFKASETNYITNPGSGSFFVKINTFDTATEADMVPGGEHNVDGGVTVANVMTDSIHITTKVLETMSFSVGTRNRDTVALNCGATFALPSNDPARIAAIANGCEAASGAKHGKCDAIQNVNNNRLNLGNPDAEYSLETGKAWEVGSYWRLSSNSSGGATVYYSGDTLRNTVGDDIDEIGATKTISTPGTEQFGLAFGDLAGDTIDTGEFVTGYVSPHTTPFDIASTTGASKEYNSGATGTIDNGAGLPGTAQFAFEEASSEVPVVIAQQNTEVISCTTAKMRYIGNIGADTPAGVYTTKINYLAAPQY